MRRVIFGTILALLASAPAFASSCVITEYDMPLTMGVQIKKLKPLRTPQNITTSGASAQSAALSPNTQTVRLWCDTQSAFEGGANPTASATVSTPLSAGLSEYFQTDGGDKIAFILRP